MNIYVGNLAFSARENELREAFARYGQVSAVQIIVDRRTKRSRGYAFVEMADEAQAREAIQSLNGTEFKGRTLRVDESRPRADAPRPASAPRGRSPAQPSPAPPRPEPRRGLFGFLRRLFS